jgi:hypothetical protein
LATLHWAGENLRRRLELSDGSWLEVERELRDTLPASSLPSNSAVVRALVEPSDREGARVRYITVLPMDTDQNIEGRLSRRCSNHSTRGFRGESISPKPGLTLD